MTWDNCFLDLEEMAEPHQFLELEEMAEPYQFLEPEELNEAGLDYLPEIIVAGACIQEIQTIAYAPGAVIYTIFGALTVVICIALLI